MSNLGQRRWKGGGNIWDEHDDEKPECTYCGKNIDELNDEGFHLYSTSTRSIECCDSGTCLQEHIGQWDKIECNTI